MSFHVDHEFFYRIEVHSRMPRSLNTLLFIVANGLNDQWRLVGCPLGEERDALDIGRLRFF